MKNSKLSQLLAKLETLPMENDQNELIILDEKCEYLTDSIIGADGPGSNSSCNNHSCYAGYNGSCTNGSCGGNITNSRCNSQ